MAISKTQIKHIQSLHQKKSRQMYGKFLVEGDKNVRELLASSFKIDAIYATESWMVDRSAALHPIERVTESELQKISTHTQPDGVIAVVEIPPPNAWEILPDQMYLYLDDINDPGNLGSIIRIADWFGIAGVILSPHTVELYNPKTVSAAKGSLYRVATMVLPLADLHIQYSDIPLIGAVMEGQSIYSHSWQHGGIVVIGNEANGISPTNEAMLSHRVTIPPFGGAESLNAAIATSIIVSEWRRQIAD